MKKSKAKLVLGWREWVLLPTLCDTKIKAKLDTGALTSALHAVNITTKNQNGVMMAYFEIYPIQRNSTKIKCKAKLLGIKKVRSSNGLIEKRPTIETELVINNTTYRIAITLTNREQMGFRLLLGRSALKAFALIDPGRSFLLDE